MDEETKKELARYKRYSATLEKKVKSLRNALDQIRITLEGARDSVYPRYFNLDSVDGRVMLSIVEKALKEK